MAVNFRVVDSAETASTPSRAGIGESEEAAETHRSGAWRQCTCTSVVPEGRREVVDRAAALRHRLALPLRDSLAAGRHKAGAD
jgi:hypothetical protein